MARALYAIQCHPTLEPRLTALRHVCNAKHPFVNSGPSQAPKSNMTKDLSPSSYPYKISIKCNSLAGSRPPAFPFPHGISPSNLAVTESNNPRAIDTVLDLYSAIRNRNPQAFSSLIADSCKCTCHFTPLCNVIEGKKLVVGFLTALLGAMGEHMQFEIENSCHGEGDHVGVLWHLEWKGNHVPSGKGCTFYSCENKEGKLQIRNIEMFMESFLLLGFLQLRLMGMLMLIFSKCINLVLKWIGIGGSV